MNTRIEQAGHVPDFLIDDIKWQQLIFSNNSQSLNVNVPILTAAQCQILSDHIKLNSTQFLKKQNTTIK